ncbi:MAG: hypothetical protein KDA93_18485 [Planctomycetaceae bacterium]|nr:hypothetical protein [Planctomycetaceae bacterium]
MTDKWTDDDFDSLGWHDCHFHGFQIVQGECGAASLWFDLDYIIDWLCPTNETGPVEFRIAPALLKFRDVSDLRIKLDYRKSGAAVMPFSIAGIERELLPSPQNSHSYRWAIEVNWPTGSISFDSPGFAMNLTGPVTETDQQCLSPSERNQKPDKHINTD